MRSQSRARAKLERIRRLRKKHRTSKTRSEAESQPERSTIQDLTTKRISKKARDSRRMLEIPKQHCTDTTNIPSLQGDSMLLKLTRVLLVCLYLFGWVPLSLGIDPQRSVCTGCCTG